MVSKTVSSVLAASMVFASAMAPVAASANENAGDDCACKLLNSSTVGPVGAIDASQGEVLASAKSGLVPAKAGTPLVSGSQVMVGPNSSARLSLGSDCSVNVLDNSEAVVIQEGESMCLRVYETGVTTQNPGDPVVDPTTGIIIGVIGVTGAVIYFTTLEEDDSAS